MFIKKSNEIPSNVFRSDMDLEYEIFNPNNDDLRIIPPFPGGPGPGKMKPPPPFPGGPGPGHMKPPPFPGGPGPGHMNPPPFPGGPGPVIPPPGNKMPPPPPKHVPLMPKAAVKQVSPISIRPCRYQYVYVWLVNGNSFWVWPTNITRRTLVGFRWNGFRWVYIGLDLNSIIAFECYGRPTPRKEDNVVSYLNTQLLSPEVFSLEYPFINNPSNENVSNVINEEIIEELDSLLLSEVLVPEKIDFTKVQSSYEVPLDANQLLSIVMSLYTLTKGSENGHTTFTSLTVDLNTGEVYEFDDLFNNNTDYRRYLSTLAKSMASKMGVNFIAPYDGITDTQKFYLNPEELVLYYQPEEFTPYESGLFRISIPYNQLTGILAPNSPIKKLL